MLYSVFDSCWDSINENRQIMTINGKNLSNGDRPRQFAAKSTSRPIWDAPRLDLNGLPNIAPNLRPGRLLQFATKGTSARRIQVATKRTSPRVSRFGELPQFAVNYRPARGRILQVASKRTAPTSRIQRQTARKSTFPQIRRMQPLYMDPAYMDPVYMDHIRYDNYLPLTEDEQSDSDLDDEEEEEAEEEVIIIGSDDDDDDEGNAEEDPPSNGNNHAPIGV